MSALPAYHAVLSMSHQHAVSCDMRSEAAMDQSEYAMQVLACICSANGSSCPSKCSQHAVSCGMVRCLLKGLRYVAVKQCM